MFVYEKKLQYPVKIANPNPKLAAAIISQYGGPDGELGASLRYLSQRYSMPYPEVYSTKIQQRLIENDIDFFVRNGYFLNKHFGNAFPLLHAHISPFSNYFINVIPVKLWRFLLNSEAAQFVQQFHFICVQSFHLSVD